MKGTYFEELDGCHYYLFPDSEVSIERRLGLCFVAR